MVAVCQYSIQMQSSVKAFWYHFKQVTLSAAVRPKHPSSTYLKAVKK